VSKLITVSSFIKRHRVQQVSNELHRGEDTLAHGSGAKAKGQRPPENALPASLSRLRKHLSHPLMLLNNSSRLSRAFSLRYALRIRRHTEIEGSQSHPRKALVRRRNRWSLTLIQPLRCPSHASAAEAVLHTDTCHRPGSESRLRSEPSRTHCHVRQRPPWLCPLCPHVS